MPSSFMVPFLDRTNVVADTTIADGSCIRNELLAVGQAAGVVRDPS